MTALAVGTLLILVPAWQAAEKQETPAEALRAIKQDREKIDAKYSEALEKAKTDEEQNKLYADMRKETQGCVLRALELAQKHPEADAAFDALEWIVTGGLGYFPETWKALDLIQRDHLASKKLGLVCLHARVYRSNYSGTEKFLRAVLEKNPDPNVQGLACYSLAVVQEDYSVWAKGLKDPAKGKQYEQGFPSELAQKLKDSDPEKLLKEAEALYERSAEKYGDVKFPGGKSSVKERAEGALFEMRHLQVGQVAPEIEGEDVEGKKFKLSDYRGKVVVLDFWGHW
jgi:hypothetical protein